MLGTAQFVMVLDSTVMNVSISQMVAELLLEALASRYAATASAAATSSPGASRFPSSGKEMYDRRDPDEHDQAP